VFFAAKADYASMYPYIAEATVIIVVLGVIDDLRELSYSQKFFFQFFAASLMVLGAIKSHLFPEVFSLEASGVLLSSVAMVVSLLWMVGTTNAINMIDGMDGLAGGTSLISAAAMGLVAMLWGNPVLGAALFVLSGAILGFLAFNVPPARVFMGDGGSMFIGFILSVSGWLLIDSGPATLTSLAVPVIILGLPVSDTLLAFFRRIVRGTNPFSADLYHIHHMLRAKRGFSTKTTVAALMSVSLVYAGAGVIVAVSSTTVGFVFIGVLFAAKLAFLHWLGYRDLIAVGQSDLRPVNVLPLNGNGVHKNGTNGHHGLNGNGKTVEAKGRRARFKP
jgi:UDP-GlcNAc:undecaprenyl-phosphate GlcNAc-1-phosphate transferase